MIMYKAAGPICQFRVVTLPGLSTVQWGRPGRGMRHCSRRDRLVGMRLLRRTGGDLRRTLHVYCPSRRVAAGD